MYQKKKKKRKKKRKRKKRKRNKKKILRSLASRTTHTIVIDYYTQDVLSVAPVVVYVVVYVILCIKS